MIKEQWTDSTGSYIRLSGDDKERMCDRILTGNCVKGILPLDIEFVNGKREYVYETSGYRSLSESLEDGSLSKEQWLHIFMDILKTGYELEQYLLDCEHMVISCDTVFIRSRDLSVGCIYRAEHKAAVSEQLNRLCEQVLKYPEYDRGQTEFIYRMHAVTVGENVTVKTIRDFLAEEGGEHEKYETMEEDKPLPTRRSGARGKEKTRAAEKAAGRTVEKSKKTAWTEDKAKAGVREKKDHTGVKNMSISSYSLPICLICVGAVIPTICMYLGLFRSSVSGSTDVTKAVCAYAFFLSVAFYGAFRLCPRKTGVLVWEEEEELSVCLLPQASGLCAIPVGMFPWQIGRDERSVDAVIDREGIAPIHARFDRESESVYVTDEESSSGTLLNHSRLTPWEKTRLRDGDILSFGATSYVVEITEG